MQKGKKYSKWIGDNQSSLNNYLSDLPSKSIRSAQIQNIIPKQLCLPTRASPGVCLGYNKTTGTSQYIGIPQGTEGNVLIIGGCGSGKSSGIAKPTLCTWRGSICATDVKGELSDFYKNLYEQGIVTRPFKIFDPMQDNCSGYDSFYCISQDNDYDLINKVQEIASIIIPLPPDIKEPFWIQNEVYWRLLYYIAFSSD